MAKKKKNNKSKLKVLIGFLLLFISLILIISFISYFLNWKVDQSNISEILDRSVKTENYLGKIGATLSHLFIYQLFGIASFIIPIILCITSYYLLLEKNIPLSEERLRRLQLISKIDRLGAGFSIATNDLDIRGAGNIIGSEQSGHIKELSLIHI